MKIYYHDKLSSKSGFASEKPLDGILTTHPERMPRNNYNSRAIYCPAIQMVEENTFSISSPYGMTIQSAVGDGCETSGWMVRRTSTIAGELAPHLVRMDSPIDPDNSQRTVQLTLDLCFWTDKDCMLYIDKYLGNCDNIKIINSAMNIGRWMRAIHFGFECDINKEITFDFNEPLFQVKFFPYDSSTVELVHKPEMVEKTKSFQRAHYHRASLYLRNLTREYLQKAELYWKKLQKWNA